MISLRHLLLLTTALVSLAAPAAAGPKDGTVVGGSATISNPGTGNVTVNQFSDKAIINWRLFDVGNGERVQFVQPGSSSIILNRVTGGLGPSQILGTIDANGRVFIINRDGILFGPNSQVNTAGFLATTHDIRNDDFMAGRFQFNIAGRPDASIVNMGTITASNGGFAALVAPGVRNSGIIQATLGTIGLASANGFSLDFYGDKLVTLGLGDQIASSVRDVATGLPLKSLVTNDGKIKANGGRVELTAAAARQVVDSVINTTGVIEANSVGVKNGVIVLGAATAADKPAGAPTQTVKISGTLSAAGKKKGTKGGTVIATGENIEVSNATINVSGREGGGKVLIGGDWGGGKPTMQIDNRSAKMESFAVATASTVSIDAATRIDASAKGRGDGGKVIVWSDKQTDFLGTILALGGKRFGDGGFAEVSSKGVLNYAGVADLRATNGRFGTLLLDPYNITISNAADSNMSSGPTFTPTGEGSVLNVTTLQNALALANVLVTTGGTGSPGTADGNITVDSYTHITWSSGSTLTLSAHQNIFISYDATITNTGSGSLILRADNSGTGTGTVSFYPTTPHIDFTGSTGKVAIYYNPISYTSPTDFTPNISLASPGQLTAYMLVNSVSDLQAIGTNSTTLTQNYALGRSINVDGVTIGPIGGTGLGGFSGIFDGQNQAISNAVIAPNSAGVNQVGLFTTINPGGVVRDLFLYNFNVTANPAAGGPGQFVGVLAGQNYGSISNVVVVNSMVSNGTVQNGVTAGGLVGQNSVSIDMSGTHIGSITSSAAAVIVTVGDSTTGFQNNHAGGLVGVNIGTITSSGASGSVSGGTNSFVGGLVGRNGGVISDSVSITNAFISAADAFGTAVGGLVGFNVIGSSITGSGASGNVSTNSGGFAGGLVGQNDGVIGSSVYSGGTVSGSGTGIFQSVSIGGLVGTNNSNGSITGSFSTGTINLGSYGFGGGLVGFNGGSITLSGSSANVNASGSNVSIGGLVGQNGGTITNGSATGNVTSTFVATSEDDNITLGGLVGQSHGTITGTFLPTLLSTPCGLGFSCASGNVTGGPYARAGGLVGESNGQISFSFALGNVTVGSDSLAGGLVGVTNDSIANSRASGFVIGGSDSFLGGLVGGIDIGGIIANSQASGNVTSTGPNSVVGGLGAGNFGIVQNSSSSGAVTGTSESYLGGLLGLNAGLVQDSTTSSTVTGTGSHNFAGGLVGINFGFIDPTTSSGDVSSGPNSIVGGFIGVNGALQFPGGGPQFIGTYTSDSFGTGQATGGPGSTVGPQVGYQYPTSGAPDLPRDFCSNNGGFCGGTLFNPNPADPNQPHPDDKITSPQLVVTNQLTKDPDPKTPDNPINTDSSPPGGQQKGGGQQQPTTPQGAWFGPNAKLGSGLPPLNETRFLSNEIVLQVRDGSADQINEIARQLGLEVIATTEIGLLGRTIYRFRITGGRSVRDLIPLLEAYKTLVAQAQPVYTFELTQVEPASRGEALPKGDASQYIVGKLRLPEVHVLATGRNVLVAVVDSTIDFNHPDLAGVIKERFDAVGAELSPHAHGTGMAGAIASHRRLLGVAPNARLLAVQAFGAPSGGAQGTSLAIVKGLNWAVEQGARVINMSFAGPKDPILEQAIKGLREKGIVLIAAAGNAGPKSPPLYPGADPNVIAVQATDADDGVYRNGNRGKYVAIAAPGVDILVPAPDGGYQLTTGTSVAAAHVSGVVALLLERNPNLKPDEIRKIITSTATKLKAKPEDVGAGLIDPYDALVKVGPKTARAQ